MTNRSDVSTLTNSTSCSKIVCHMDWSWGFLALLNTEAQVRPRLSETITSPMVRMVL